MYEIVTDTFNMYKVLLCEVWEYVIHSVLFSSRQGKKSNHKSLLVNASHVNNWKISADK